MTNFNIAIVSDTVCPWCYVGKNKLERGIAAYKAAHPDAKDTFSTTWSAFYLNPDSPKEGTDKRQMYRNKFGEERTRMMHDRLTKIGQDVGINFKYGGRTGNSRDSHRLIQLGKKKGPEVQTRVVEELFSAYFENEQDITSHEMLHAAGVKAGLDSNEVKEWLASERGGKEVDEEAQNAYANTVSGVPIFTIQGEFEISGAQDPETFNRIFEKIKAVEG